MRNWDDARIFLHVARAQRIAPAARALGIDVSTVTRRIARLEAESATPLFEGLAGLRRLTEAGEALLLQAETIEATLMAMSTVGEDRLQIAGTVRLSLAEGLATHVVAPGLATFQARHPNLRLDLITASGFLDPSKREADIAIMLARPRNRQLRTERLADYRLRLQATAEYLAVRGLPHSPANLHDHVLIGYVAEHLHAPELDYLSEIQPGLTPALRSTSINVQRAMVLGGAGIGVLPDFMIADDPELRPVLEGTVAIHRTFWLTTHRDTHQTPRVKAVCDWLQKRVMSALPQA